MKRWIVILGVLVSPVVLWAAQPGPTPDPGLTSPFEWYSSVTGVIAATMLLVSIAKRALANVTYANAVPTWIYAVGISIGLTIACVEVLGTLPGPLWQTLMQAVIMAGSASGIYEWINNSTKTLAASARSAGVTVTNPPPPRT